MVLDLWDGHGCNFLKKEKLKVKDGYEKRVNDIRNKRFSCNSFSCINWLYQVLSLDALDYSYTCNNGDLLINKKS